MGRLSEIESGVVEPTAEEMHRIAAALQELINAREQLAKVAQQVGWPGRI